VQHVAVSPVRPLEDSRLQEPRFVVYPSIYKVTIP
jgi:hypothetical protein